MDLIKIDTSYTGTLVAERGSVINGIDEYQWIERYQDPGEFKIIANANTNLMFELPLGTLIGNTDSLDMMVVENINLKESKKGKTTVEISGRSVISVLDQRVVGANIDPGLPYLGYPPNYTLAANYTWNQIVEMITFHTHGLEVFDPLDEIPGMLASSVVAGTGVNVERVIKKGSLLTRTLELLKLEDLGIRAERTSPPFTTYSTKFVVHNGLDKRDVVFAWIAGDLDDAEYLWSNKKQKTAALALGTYVETRVPGSGAYLTRRYMLVDATDIDDWLDTAPDPTAKSYITTVQGWRANEALAANQLITVINVDISRSTKKRFRKDYNIGDIVTVQGNYGTSATMRVVEHAELKDKSGESGYPTLSLVE